MRIKIDIKYFSIYYSNTLTNLQNSFALKYIIDNIHFRNKQKKT